jgi:DNA (cytosine-5)-methyltransferase 1
VCSGIEAATVAWHPLGWTAAAYSEIEKFPSQVLAHHYPDVPNVGDMTKFKEWNIGAIDLLVGGTPCQSFSVAGLRKGLDDPRGNLMLTFLAIADQHRPRWLVWENVPGVLSSNGGKDFGTFLGALGELGYGFAYRILDAQYFGVAQRRRRVFVVGYLGDWRAAAAVLFERHSLSGDSAPSREKRKEAAGGARAGAAISSHWDGDYPHPTLNQSAKGSGGVGFSNQEIFSQRGAYLAAQPIATHGIGEGGELARCLNACDTASGRMDVSVDTFISQPIALQDITAREKAQNGKGWNDDGSAYTVDTHATQGVMQPIAFTTEQTPKYNHDQALTLTKQSPTGGGQPQCVMQPIPFDTTQITSKANYSKPESGDPCHPLAAGAHPPAIAQPIAFSGQMSEPQTDVDMTQTLQARNPMAVCLMDQGGSVMNIEHDMSGTLRRETHGHEPIVMQSVAFEPGKMKRLGYGDAELGLSPTLRASAGDNQVAASVGMAVRRLTPVECERLQGFPDNYTDIQHKGKATPDGPRYKALGNSMAVPVMAWIGKRIQEVEQMQCKPNK